MKINENILAPILQSTQLQDHVDDLKPYLASEEEKRMFFYNKIAEQKKSEFINGEIICHSPVKSRHNQIGVRLTNLCSPYIIKNNLGYWGVEKVLIRLTRNDFEPDLCFFNSEKAAKIKEDLMFFPIPDLVVEILSESTEHRDRGIKMEDYALHGVLEYWLIDADKKIVEKYLLNTKLERFDLDVKIKDGIIKVETIPELEFDIKAIFDDLENLKALHQILK